MNISSPAGGIVFVIAILAIVAISIYLARRRAKRRNRAAQSWPTIEGKILTSKVLQNSDSESEPGDYRASVTYSYTLNGKDYKGRRIGFLTFASTQQKAAAVAARYLPGASVMVHYDPANPKDSVLELEPR
jgi:hypothetical protein